MRRPVLVIGGGVAGGVCALRLRQHGVETHLAEKVMFPRAKVCGCCLGGAGLSVLQLVDLKDWVLRNGVITHHWNGSLGRHRIQVPIASGVAISRELLDSEILNRLRSLGAVVHAPVAASVESLEADHVRVALTHPDGRKKYSEYELVVLASGLNATGGNRLLPWKESPNGPFGASFFAEVDSLQEGVIGMACSDDGYVGVVRLEDGRFDVAAALAAGARAGSGGRPINRMLNILNESNLDLGHVKVVSEIQVTPPLRRSRIAGTGRLMAIGDASGYVEPFTGEGMTWGMMSGYDLADLIFYSQPNFDQLGETWGRQLSRLLATRRRTCRAITSILQSSVAREGAGYLLSRVPSLARPLTSHLSRPWSPTF